MIRLEAVSVRFEGAEGRGVEAVRSLDLDVARGETLSLIGASGCGKTTTLRLINRLLQPSAGRVLVDGEDIAHLDPIRLRRRTGYVIQGIGLFPHLTVCDNIGLLCQLEGWDRARTRARVDELLDLVRLPGSEFGERFPAELSGGQQQRVGVARALALDPPVVLMDEPFGALDPLTRDELQAEFMQLRQAVQKTIVLVSHDMHEAFLLADRVAFMEDGRVAQVGTRADFRERPANEHVASFVARHLLA